MRLKVSGGMTPYRLVNYDVFWRSRVAVAGHYRGLVNYSEALHGMSLVPTEEYKTLLTQVREAGGWSLPDAPMPKHTFGALSYHIKVSFQGKAHEFKVTGAAVQADPRYLDVVSLIRNFVVKQTGKLPFRNVFFEPGTFGYLNLTSVPVAKITLDGRALKLETPIYGYELKAGDHTVLLKTEKGYERKYTLRVEPGMTTVIHFDLR